MALNLKGSGHAFWRDSTTKTFIPLFPLTFSWEEERETEESQGYPFFDTGILQTQATISTSSSWTLTLEQEYLSPEAYDIFLFGQPSEEVASVDAPVTSETAQTVPASPHEVTVSGLATDQEVDVTLINADGSITPLTRVAASGTPGPGEFTVDTDTLTFDAAEEGKTFAYYYRETLTTQEIIGGPSSVAEYDGFEIYAAYSLTTTPSGIKHRIWFPNCSWSGGSAGSVGSTDALEKEIAAAIPQSLGWNKPYMKWDA